ncbi:MAG: GGDEF domain-containing protein [Alphaproteobacteria bacterium]|jgi:diguanylate cyclase|nr:GGDEF domain-containing protein [Alphaproteobacteria bacterium]
MAPPDSLPASAAAADSQPQASNASRRLALARSYATAALAALSEHELPPIPPNYSMFFDMAEGSRPDLRLAMEAAQSRGPLDEATMHGLAGRFFQPTAEAMLLAEAISRINQTLQEALLLVSDHGAEAEAFGERLTELAGTISPEPKRLAEVLRRLTTETSAMIARSRQTSGRISESASLVESLRGELEAARQQAVTDALTGLPNRRAFDDWLPSATSTAEASGSPVALLIMDIDHFKTVNDRFGHPVGDAVLRRTAQTLRGVMRDGDLPARTGGEEFAALLPATTQREAHDIAERVRQAVAAQSLTIRATGTKLNDITISIGLAMRHHGETPLAWMQRADAALYRAKQEGRNRVVNAEPRAVMSWG